MAELCTNLRCASTFDLPPKLPRLGIADVPFAARIGDGLPEQIDPATRTEKVCHGSADRCEWNALVDGDVVFGEVRSVYDDALRLLPPQSGGFRDREVNQMGVRIRDSIHGKSRCMRNGQVVGPAVGFGPKHGFPVLRKPTWRKMRNAVNASGCSFEPPSLYEAGQDRISETSRSGLLGGDQTVVVLSKFYKFVETRARIA